MLYRIFPKRLDIQLALLCIMVFIFTMPWFIIHESNEDFEYFMDGIENEIKVLASNIGVTSVEYIVTNDFSSMENLLKRSVLFPGVVDIQVMNEQGRILGDVYKNSVDEPEVRYTDIPILTIPTIISHDYIVEKNYITVWSPIVSGTVLGWVKLNYSLESANNHKNERVKDYVKDVSIVATILILLLLLAMRRPLKMISEAANFANRLDERTGEQIPIISRSIELDKLYLALNRASENLANQEATINKFVKDLETQKHALDQHSIVSILDINGNITYANDKLLNLTGFKTDELIGKTYHDKSSGIHDELFYNGLWNAISNGKVWHGEIVNLSKSKKNIWMKTTIVPFLDNDSVPYEYVSIQTDITKQKNTESLLAEKNISLKELADQLENKVKTRTLELQNANEELLHLNTIKSDFVSIVSHELRTPLTSIKSFSEILEDDIDELDSDTIHQYLSIINEESARLGKLINDVLDLQKIDSGKMTWNKEDTTLNKLVSTSINLFSKLFQKKSIELILNIPDEEILVNVDSDRIKQVLSNLLSNAYKFTDKGKVTLKLKKVIYQPTVLLLNNENSSRIVIENLLDEMNVKVINCTRSDETLNVIKDKKRKIDLFIIDIIMSEIDGIQLVKLIKNNNKNLPILVISSKENNIVLRTVLDYVVTEFVDKNIDPLKFVSAIKNIFGSMEHDEDNRKMVEISVIDTGTGIPEKELNKVFERFHQVDNSETREKGGSGLGLPICQDIIQNHDGQLWVNSILGEGSCFTFSLPLIDQGKKHIGEILIEAGVVTQEEINFALSNRK